MARVLPIACAAVALLAGCGGTADAPVPAAPVAATPAPPVVVAAADGRLGAATAATRDAAPRVRAGGRPDVTAPAPDEPRDGVGAGAACPTPEVSPVVESLPAVVLATLCLVNAERVDRGLPRLTQNARLADAARRYAADLVAGQYFSHTGRDGSDIVGRLRRVNYIPADRAWAVGENLAWGTGALATPVAIVRAWMNSPGHRANVLNARYREVGLGVVVGNPAGAEGIGATYASAFGVVAAPAKRKPRRQAARSARRTHRR